MVSNLSQTNTTLVTQREEDEGSVVDSEHIILYLTLSFFSVLGVVGNAIAFYIFFRRRNTGTSVIFILALAGTDFITCLVTVPYTMVFEALGYSLYYDGLCKMYMFFITSTIPFSSLIMAGIAFDRYFCICHPFLHVLNVQRARMAVLSLALPPFTFGVITAMSYGKYLVHDSLLVNGTFLLGTNISMKMAEHPVFPDSFLNVSELDHKTGGHVIETDLMFVNDTRVYRVQAYRELVRNTECISNYLYFSEEFQTWFHRVYTSCYVLCFVTVMVLYTLIYKSIFNRRAMKAKRRRKNYYTSVANTDTHVPKKNQSTAPEAETVVIELNGNGNGSLLTPTSAATADAPTSTTITTITTADDDDRENATTTTSLIGPQDGEEEGGGGGEGGDGSAEAVGVASSADDQKKKNGSKDSNGAAAAAAGGGGGGVGGGGGGGGGGENAGETTRLPKRRNSTTRDRNLYANIKTAMMLFVVTLVFIVAFAPASFMAHDIIPVQLNVFYMYFVYNVANPFIYAFMNQSFREDLKKLLKRS